MNSQSIKVVNMNGGYSFHDEMHHQKWPLYKWHLSQKRYKEAQLVRQEIKRELSCDTVLDQQLSG